MGFEYAVVIPTNRLAREVVHTVRACEQALTGFRVELVVVDNDYYRPKSDFTVLEECVSALGNARIVTDTMPGLLTGRMRGAIESESEVIVYLDDDVLLGPEWAKALLTSFDDPSVALVGGPSEPEWEGPVPDWLHEFIRYRGAHVGECGWLSLLDLGPQRQIIDPNYVWGLNFAIRRSVLKECGGFHPDCMPDSLQHFQGDGETGLTRKIKARGWKAVYEPRMKVRHRIGSNRLTPAYFFRRAFYQGVCESYTKIRIEHGVDTPANSNPRQRWFGYLRNKVRVFRDRWANSFATIRKERDPGDVKAGTERAHRAGREFHRIAFDSCPAVRDWVLKPDYWDYKLPESRFDATAVRRACLTRHAVPTIW